MNERFIVHLLNNGSSISKFESLLLAKHFKFGDIVKHFSDFGIDFPSTEEVYSNLEYLDFHKNNLNPDMADVLRHDFDSLYSDGVLSPSAIVQSSDGDLKILKNVFTYFPVDMFYSENYPCTVGLEISSDDFNLIKGPGVMELDYDSAKKVSDHKNLDLESDILKFLVSKYTFEMSLDLNLNKSYSRDVSEYIVPDSNLLKIVSVNLNHLTANNSFCKDYSVLFKSR